MNNTDKKYPQKTCEIDRLVTNPKLVAAALSGKKTEQRRNGVYAYPGEKFTLEGVEFEVTALERQTLGEMSEEDAQREGMPDLTFYKDIILKMHAGMDWSPDHKVWVHRFRKIPQAG